MTGNWSLIVPETTTNLIVNPSAETTGNFAAIGGATVTRVTTYSRRGAYSYRVQTTNAADGIQLTLKALANAIHYCIVWMRGSITTWQWSVDGGSNGNTPTLLTSDGSWYCYGFSFPAAQCNGSTALWIFQTGASACDFWIDENQLEQKEYATTYCDGDQPGCEWNGTRHGSSSTRSAQSRAGGRVVSFDSYSFYVTNMTGQGMPTTTLNYDEYALLPGGEFQGWKPMTRVMTLEGRLASSTVGGLHTLRQALLNVLKLDKTAALEEPWILRYSGATLAKEIKAYLDTGLSFALSGRFQGYEPFALRFLCPDPMWYGLAESAAVLDVADSVTTRYLAARLKSTGQWSALGLTSNPATNGQIYAVAIGPDKCIYVGGNFTHLNGVAGRDYIAKYDPVAGTWSDVGDDDDFTGIIYDLKFDANGILYAVGAFTDCHGDLDADYVAQWNGTVWNNVGQPSAGATITDVKCIAFDHSGNMYVGGTFTEFAGVAAADYFAKWDGSTWTAVGSGGTGTVNAIAIDSNDYIAIGGDFTNWAADANADYLAWWNKSAWAAIPGTTSGAGIVYSLAISADDVLYIGGDFTNLGGLAAADYIAKYNGYGAGVVEALGAGLDGIVYKIAFGPDGRLWAGGAFTLGNAAADLAVWNGASWSSADIDLPGTPLIRAITAGDSDPTIPQNYDIWLGLGATGASLTAGTATVTNSGTTAAYPKVVFNRTDANPAIVVSLRNETTGKQINFDYGLLQGETLTVDLRPDRQSVTSSFFGNRLDAVLSGSDFSTFCLQPGANQITCLVQTSGSPTATMTWKETYWSLD